MSGETTVQVNFGDPMPLFPLNGTVLMPHGVLHLHMFEPRYRQMAADILESTRQFATATFQGDRWEHEYHGRPPIRPVVCVSHIIQDAEFPDGTYGLIVQGLCRARVIEELPADEEKLYRRAFIKPLDLEEPDEEALASFRRSIMQAMESDRLADLRGAQGMVEHLRNQEIPTSAILEVLGFQFLADQEVRYRLLACEDHQERAEIVADGLMDLKRLLRRARPQRDVVAPKGCHWN